MFSLTDALDEAAPNVHGLLNPDMSRPRYGASFSRVTTELDVNRVQVTAALRAFTRRSLGTDVSSVFYAGQKGALSWRERA